MEVKLMNKYNKVLVAFKDEELNCFASQGEWLYIAGKNDKKKGLFRLPSYLHYFVSIKERVPNEYGVVKTIDEFITAIDLANLDYKSRKKNPNSITQEELEKYEWFLEQINKFPEHTPIGASWLEKRFPKQEKQLRVHKKFFSGMSQEEKESIFNFKLEIHQRTINNDD